MKFKECISIFGELLNKDEIFGNLRDMQNIKKIKLRVRGRETSCTNVFDGESLTVTNADLIRAHVVISFNVQASQIRSDMVSYSRVRIPILIRAVGWGREICLSLSRLFTRIRLIEPVVAIQGNMTKAVADLT
jgi:hypothetical protein